MGNRSFYWTYCKGFSGEYMKKINEFYRGANNRESTVDITIPSIFSGKIVLFVHGFMGFKDWGAWYLVEKYFLTIGFGFCKYNVSHNGCTSKNTIDFEDLEAFGENNYTKEIADLKAVIDWIETQIQPFPELYVIGHSRGGGIVLLSHFDSRIQKIATWAAISDIEKRFPPGAELNKWKVDGVRYQVNGRTNQKMPMNYSQFEDFKKNESKLSIQNTLKILTKPVLLVHGDLDTSVSISEGKDLAAWSGAPLHIIKGANHTFNSSHPWEKTELPTQLEEVCKQTAAFFLGRSN